MATVIMMPLLWQANRNATFALARELERRGHRVLYLGIPDASTPIRAQGFEHRPIFDSVLPMGALAAQEAQEARGIYGGMPAFRARVRTMCDLMERGEIERALGDVRPDLFVVASQSPWVALGAWKTGIPVTLFSSNLLSVRDPAVPPYATGLGAGSDPLARLRSRWAWATVLHGRWWQDPYRLEIHRDLEGFARRCGFPTEQIDFDSESWPLPRLPHLVFHPAEIDFPRTRVPAATWFVEPGIDRQRREPVFAWEWLDPDRPLVYGALGSVAGFRFAAEGARFFQAFLDALRKRPGWQGVAAIGRHIDLGHLRCPPNVRVVRDAPQLALLSKAAVCVCHAGFGTVKEAVFHGVPLLVFPISFDHPGTAARVVHHRLGLKARFDGITPARLGSLMDEIVRDGSFATRARQMSRVFTDLQERSPSTPILEGLLRRRAEAFP